MHHDPSRGALPRFHRPDPSGRLVPARALSALSGLAVTCLTVLLAGACSSSSDAPATPGDSAPATDPGGGTDGPGPAPEAPPMIAFELPAHLRLGGGARSDSLSVDLDGDGDPDLVEAGLAELELRVGLGGPGPRVVPLESHMLAGAPRRLAAGDFDGDGLVDVAVACASLSLDSGPGVVVAPANTLDAVVVLLGEGDGHLVPAATLELPSAPFDLDALPGGAGEEILVTLPDTGSTWRLALQGDQLVRLESLAAPAGTTPFSVLAADGDGDGALEALVAVTFGPQDSLAQVVVHPGLDVGGSPKRFASESEPLEDLGDLGPVLLVELGVGSDGLPRLAACELAGEGVVLFAGSPAGLVEIGRRSFGGPVSTALGADLNGDGLRDLVCGLLTQSALAVLFAEAEDDYGPARYYAIGQTPHDIVAAEVDAAPGLDLLVGCLGETRVLGGDGSGAFGAARGDALDAQPRGVVVGDFDGDEYLDAVVSAPKQGRVLFLRGDGRGFEPAGDALLGEPDLESAAVPVARDFDGDGDLDVALTVVQKGEVAFFVNEGGLPLVPGVRVPVGEQPLGLDAGDLDGDGRLDLVVANYGGASPGVQVLKGDGQAYSVLPVQPTDYAPVAVRLADLDADGALDLVVSTRTPGVGAHLLVHRGVGNGTFGSRPAAVFPLGSTAEVLRCEDLDGDGLLEILAGQPGTMIEEIVLLAGLGGLAFEERSVPVGPSPTAFELADLDEDGALDLVAALGDGTLQVVRGDGDGGFGPPLFTDPERGIAHGATALVLGDVDGDARPDAISVSPRSRYLWFARNLTAPE